MKINKTETIILGGQELNSWIHVHSILQEIYNEADDDEIKELSVRVKDYMEQLEKYFY